MGKVLRNFLVWALCIALLVSFLVYSSQGLDLTPGDHPVSASTAAPVTPAPPRLPNISGLLK